jgi:splicing factor 3A subunit 1
MSQLAQRESRNYQFDFLRPSHSMFNYFTSLVTQYTQLFVPPRDIKDRLKKNVDDKYDVLDRVKARVEWIAWVEAEKKKKQDEDEKERGMFFTLPQSVTLSEIVLICFLIAAYAAIDWHDFVIVETVEFTQDDERLNLPPPMSLSELENMSLEQKKLAAMAESTQPVEQDVQPNDEMEVSNRSAFIGVKYDAKERLTKRMAI